jgi:saccharolysin
LDQEKREEVKLLRTKISNLGAVFSSNLNEENTVLEFTRDELEGVPLDLVNSFEKVYERYRLRKNNNHHNL